MVPCPANKLLTQCLSVSQRLTANINHLGSVGRAIASRSSTSSRETPDGETENAMSPKKLEFTPFFIVTFIYHMYPLTMSFVYPNDQEQLLHQENCRSAQVLVHCSTRDRARKSLEKQKLPFWLLWSGATILPLDKFCDCTKLFC